jgi:hypothetical protein
MVRESLVQRTGTFVTDCGARADRFSCLSGYLVCLVEQDKPDELVQLISLSCSVGAVEE